MTKQREVILIVGKTGSGKSTLFKEMILQKNRFIIFDTLSEYSGLSPAFPALFIHDIKELILYLQKNHNKNYRIVFDPPDPDKEIELLTGEKIKTFDLFCRVVYEGLNNVTLGIEELANFLSPNFVPEHLRKCVRFGRHSSISIFATTQRPAEIASNVRAQVTKFISFRQHEPRDIDWIRQVIGDEAFTLKDLDLFVWGKPMLKGKHYKEYCL